MNIKFSPENEFARRSSEMTGRIPLQMDNKNYGKKRKAKAHKFSVKDTKTGKVYWAPAIMEDQPYTFKTFLVTESVLMEMTDKLTILPEIVISELKKLISKGAKDITQDWADALELTDTAYHVAKVRKPDPDQKGAWKQYTDLLTYSVHQLRKTRGTDGKWRASETIYTESVDYLVERKEHRFFVKIPGVTSVEVEATGIGEIIRDLYNKMRRRGAHLEVKYKTQEGAVLGVIKDGEEREEIVIQNVS